MIGEANVDERLYTKEFVLGVEVGETAVAGPLQGAALERIKSTPVFWFGWSDFHPQTRIYSLDT